MTAMIVQAEFELKILNMISKISMKRQSDIRFTYVFRILYSLQFSIGMVTFDS